ncbi:11412_t:CDS:2, partial [Scutellospora calospora]
MSSGNKKKVEKKKTETGNKQQGSTMKISEDGGVVFTYENKFNMVNEIFEDIEKTTKENLKESKKSEAKEEKEDKDKKVEEFSFTENDSNSFSFKKIEKSKDGFSYSQFSSYSYSKE